MQLIQVKLNFLLLNSLVKIWNTSLNIQTLKSKLLSIADIVAGEMLPSPYNSHLMHT